MWVVAATAAVHFSFKTNNALNAIYALSAINAINAINALHCREVVIVVGHDR
jgi:hypothetical protein